MPSSPFLRLPGLKPALTKLGVVVVCLSSSACLAREPEALGVLKVPSLLGPACSALAYSPLSVFQAPGGLRTGRLVLDHPEFVAEAQDPCTFVPTLQLRVEGRTTLQSVDTLPVDARMHGLAVREIRQATTGTWFRGLSDGTSFWVRLEPGEVPERYLSYEAHLVRAVSLLSETCDAQGRCQPMPASTRATAETAGQERQDSCFANAYDLLHGIANPSQSIVTLPNGRRAYQLVLAPSLRLKYASRLPAALLVPTYDYEDRWTGVYASSPCSP